MLALPSAVPEVPHFKGCYHLYIVLHLFCLFLLHKKQSTLQKKGRLKEKQTAADEITQHLVLLDICKTPSERHDAQPRECMRARVIRTRAGMCFVFVLLYGGGIKDKCINEHLERNSLCLLVSVTASRAQTLSLTRMM